MHFGFCLYFKGARDAGVLITRGEVRKEGIKKQS